ncbi:hypothetical protein BKA58DRAFT_349026 [Alternaria rosae]|uniref:uncharacterized protein n=1 Tax=Alternaria rosae TaxID=1187941 RepID=UPI001E8DD60A|nr:uncharacterized protein BKA58DRAFT_349026 [Alternaria rosae]KAH6848476.1 hypothetical protein BKA58DRAFT_349026 [Alternaria rosae]
MPPKKKVAAAEGGEAEGGAFRWTLENANKLLILTQGRYLTGEDYERLVSVFPGTNLNGVKIKVSRFRVEQRKLFDEYGWTLPDGGAVLKKGAVDGADGEEEDELATPTKKPRGRKPKAKKEDVEEEYISSGGGEKRESVGVKEEVLDEEIEDMI